MTMKTRRGNPFGGAHKVAITLLPGALAHMIYLPAL